MAGEDRDSDAYPPPGIDLQRPSVARVYDYYLEGDASWTVDRKFGDTVLGEFPQLRQIAKANRVFLHRVVRHLMGLGVTQFIDIGSGLPTMRHAHQIADEVAYGRSRVVYADYDPIAVAHSQDLLEQHGDSSRHAAIHADLRAPDRLWEQAAATGILDLDQPLAILLIAVLHVQQPASARSGDTGDVGPAAVARYRELAPAGSYLAISHITDEGVPPVYQDQLAKLKHLYDTKSSPVVWRTHDEVRELFGTFDLIPPGLTWTTQWHLDEAPPDEPAVTFTSPNESAVIAGVAKKR
ncbi:SAM-dependent methyltransferase [Amycolatopsis sp. PS_44_ISF1]|uniref:SAM-dependent methyltransferase n=1 Tax=Amycolatopsis sp. PS_44_ISF1 TaxID=2974917 RepID=UPI0028DDEA32|nr:SAM-dependent methyltransferase [Amycolatopsis sp. PS_44_ISF1]MDT8910128.1 SAM-dependent methyltransferase [Amycolatopsis sp. PS_44_ISF1]